MQAAGQDSDPGPLGVGGKKLKPPGEVLLRRDRHPRGQFLVPLLHPLLEGREHPAKTSIVELRGSLADRVGQAAAQRRSIERRAHRLVVGDDPLADSVAQRVAEFSGRSVEHLLLERRWPRRQRQGGGGRRVGPARARRHQQGREAGGANCSGGTRKTHGTASRWAEMTGDLRAQEFTRRRPRNASVARGCAGRHRRHGRRGGPTTRSPQARARGLYEGGEGSGVGVARAIEPASQASERQDCHHVRHGVCGIEAPSASWGTVT